MRGAGVFFLDLISNTLGAMLLIFFVVVPKRFDSPPIARQETLLVEARAVGDPRVRLRLSLQPPDGETFDCQPAKHSTRASAFALAGEVRPETRPGLDTSQKLQSSDLSPPSALWARPLSPASAIGSTTSDNGCAILVQQPRPGCWRYEVLYSDYSEPTSSRISDIEIRLWWSGRRLREQSLGSPVFVEAQPPRRGSNLASRIYSMVLPSLEEGWLAIPEPGKTRSPRCP